jgi:hypothetical protein
MPADASSERGHGIFSETIFFRMWLKIPGTLPAMPGHRPAWFRGDLGRLFRGRFSS